MARETQIRRRLLQGLTAATIGTLAGCGGLFVTATTELAVESSG